MRRVPLKYNNSLDQRFSKELRKRVGKLLEQKLVLDHVIYYGKAAFFLGLYFYLWSLLSFNATELNSGVLILVLFGITSVVLGFTIGHDAGHGSFAKNDSLNKGVFYLVYNMIGLSSHIWNQCHNLLHHPYVNIPGHDIDVQENPVMRLGSHNKYFKHHRFQHIYGPILYCLFFLFKFLYNDFRCFYALKNKYGNPKHFSNGKMLEMILLKIAYVIYMIVIPCMYSGYSVGTVFLAYMLFISAISLFFAFTLGGSHISHKAEFGQTDSDNKIQNSYFYHQMSACIDFHAESKLMGYIFGGLNSHTAHHLFPSLSPIYYPGVSKIIKELSEEYKMPYKELSILKLWKEHYLHIKEMGKANSPITQ